MATFFGGFIVGFVREWRLTLLLLAFTPFLALGGAIMAKVRVGEREGGGGEREGERERVRGRVRE